MLDIPHRLGIDIGKVIVDGARNDGTDTAFFSDNFLRTTALPGAFEVIHKLVAQFGPENVFLVSKCGPRVQEKSLTWLAHHNFWKQTGMNPRAYRFCLRRPEKAAICKTLGITHFIDDRAEILVSMQGIVTHRYMFNPTDRELQRYAEHMQGEQVVRSWQELEPLILNTLR
ncbi:hypothetical protein A3C09_00130 [Candidatus Uhrbacteria bacterium RIFCSPHIGHO2_02_FULL_47_44]|uniref:FCP1 homology domain-containing protein n=1 Tax=Candidatus Uhrbacteria bacterium RIFCSPLOWO2_02_FULL_48_18 TaxID=1802408 RepID=A0A1F7V7J6_9BACT|nr:MAG: hypothetical protein A2839_01805 [Candidatus Uhrbacteria bacterium RIFCSPHIGHO2_01_FULL_47_10]OGL71624.1 MAG: hypothetical protein A3C09_00130 [Candidatus Uhrbacteria bacterium RIFCSPHIGHO2_02_FULL_47_44]OGL76593.1 MAG: hypothetical protein A3E97_04685 [Candidatus Uhrbacteria bacterium RIFCSPHIGHO2_12_FULL_47_12]OGL80791.1 MAG: hypothetical protein A3B20_05420 [Candidatus Uhrbacteria bacterium RIFCSPLOWO2_01_FULL_47_17]OGL86556.1 MAG: hypothetical protein A3I41_04685 [Candidatus Uhrbact